MVGRGQRPLDIRISLSLGAQRRHVPEAINGRTLNRQLSMAPAKRESLAFFAQFGAEMPPVRPSSLQHRSQTYRRGLHGALPSNLSLGRGQPGTAARDTGPTRHFKRQQRGTDATLFRHLRGFSRGCPRYGHDLARGAPPVKAAKSVPVRFFRPFPGPKQPVRGSANSGRRYW
jgi:hypothetical protein